MVLTGLAVVVAVAAFAWWAQQHAGPDGRTPPAPFSMPAATFVGNDACAACHQAQQKAWQGSHHDLAMQKADAAAVLGNFADAKFTYAGTTSTFFRREGRFMVNTDGADGKLADFEIQYTFGVAPLQQYLIELPGGRLQALGIAWDSRPKEAGGQRWFHLYPGQQIRAGDPLHWTGLQQNWNYMCADCHSTNLRKNYDAATRTFKTTWSQIDVGCEACHGPGSNHIAWAREPGKTKAYEHDKGLTVLLDERKGVTWPIDAKTGNAARSRERAGEREIEVCARCHSRRGQLTDAVHAGDSLHQGFRVSLLEPGLFHADGQQRDEVYNYAPFLQSRMYAKGVTCSDCHEPHTQKLRATGNGVCLQCHAAPKYDAPSHHFHAPGTAGAACAACHMPATTYMVVDPRHDHSFRVPRPDLTVSLGTPNACNACHAKQSAQWALDAIVRRTGRMPGGLQNYADAFMLAERGTPGAATALVRVIEDAGQPAIARATALRRLAANEQPFVIDMLATALNDPSPLVRMAAVSGLAMRDASIRLQRLPRMLGDPMRTVRVEAASGLADIPETRLPAEYRAAFRRALDEYVAIQQFDADRPEAQTNLGNLRARQGDRAAAVEAFRTAISLDASFVPAYVNLADLQRAGGSETEAESTLRAGIKANPGNGALYHALGLSLVRQGRRVEGITALAQAAKLDPQSARNAYVYGVALHDTGRAADALRILEAALTRHPFDRDMLSVLVIYSLEQGRVDQGREYVRRLLEVAPGDRQAQALAARLAK